MKRNKKQKKKKEKEKRIRRKGKKTFARKKMRDQEKSHNIQMSGEGDVEKLQNQSMNAISEKRSRGINRRGRRRHRKRRRRSTRRSKETRRERPEEKQEHLELARRT